MITIKQYNNIDDTPALRIRLDKVSKEYIFEIYIEEVHGWIQFHKYIYDQEYIKYKKRLEYELKRLERIYVEPVLSD